MPVGSRIMTRRCAWCGCHLVSTLLLSVVVAVATGAADNDTREQGIKKEIQSLIGTWKLASMEAGGEMVRKQIRLGRAGRCALTEKGITSTVAGEGKEENTYALDPTVRPKAIDLIDKEGRRTPGIYRVGGRHPDRLLERGEQGTAKG